MKKTTIALFQFALILFVMVLSAGCSRLVTYSQKGWTVQADPGKQSLAISHKDLGTVLSNIRLNLNKDGKIVELPGWTAKLSNNQILTLSTTSPEATTWQFIVTEEGLDINSSSDNAVITAVAPASGARIPARIRSQDNGIIYTSLGFVTAKNIYCLFDRMTDTLIQFPNKSSLVRSTDNEQLMNVTLPLLPRPGAREGRGRDRRGIKSAPGVEIYLIRDYYTKELGLAHYRPYWPQHPKSHPFETAATGWLSWYCYYMPANEEDMVRETDALAEELGPYGLEYVQLDATYTRGDGYNWLEWNKQFPHGGKWLMQYIKSKGLKPGLWINIYGADYTKPDMGANFPGGKYPEDWYLHDKDGKRLGACCTGDASESNLDYSNPEVIEKHLKPLFRTLVNDWGIEYLKDAGHARWIWNYEENRARVHNPSLEGKDLYWQAQDAVRQIMGPDRWLMGCDAEGGGDEWSRGFGPFDSTFDIMSDVYDVWESRRLNNATGTIMHLATMFSSTYTNDIVVYNDPDATMARPPLTMEEARTNITSMSLTGQAYIISDFMCQPSAERVKDLQAHTRWGKEYPQLISKLADDRVDLYRKTMPAMNITPIDLFPYKAKAEYSPFPEGYPEVTNFPKALDLKVNAKSGVYDVIAIYNWSDADADQEIPISDLGLDTGVEYLAFDFWSQDLLGVFRDAVRCNVPAHGTKAVILMPKAKTPQLMANSRHLTGAFGITTLAWNSGESALAGTSETVAGKKYSLFVYVPPGWSVGNVNADAGSVSQNLKESRILEVSFDGQKAPVNWKIKFQQETANVQH